MSKIKFSMIELFSGVGAQKRGIDNTGLYDLEVVATSDIDKEAVVEYAAIHHGLTNEMIDSYQNYPSREEMIAELKARNIGMDFDKGVMYNWDKLLKKKTKDIEKYWLAMTLQNNLGDISLIEQLPVADCWFYSSPCQCFSLAGKQDGIDATCNTCGQKYNPMDYDVEHRYTCPHCGSDDIKGTRSGLLLEVERLLIKAIETGTAPKYLCLENVKNLVGTQFKPDFDAWIKRLEHLGYNTPWSVLNAKTCGIPQNRERVFAFSIRKDIDTGKFTFPVPFDNGLRLKDVLEHEVEEKYYINTERAANLIQQLIDKGYLNARSVLLKNQATEVTRPIEVANTLMARDWKGYGNQEMVAVVECNKLDSSKRLGGLWDGKTTHQAGSVWDTNGMSPTLDTAQGGGRMPHIIEEKNNNEIQWKDIDDFPYQISEYGEIRNINTGHIRSLRKDKDGYLRTDLYSNGNQKTVKVHRLVAEYFLPKAECMECVNHKDGDIYNNHYSNLEWCSVQENVEHKHEILLHISGKINEPKGVAWNKEKEKWEASIKYHNKTQYLGRYIDKSEAYKAVYYGFIKLRGYMPWDENKHRTFLKDGETVEDFDQDDLREEKINKYLETNQNYTDTTKPICVGNTTPSGKSQCNAVYSTEGVSQTLCAGTHGYATGSILEENQYSYRIRKLTVREAFKLMGFEFSDWDKCVAVGASNTAGYKAAGNSIVTNCISLLFEHLFKAQYDESYVCTDEKMVNFTQPQVVA